MWPFSKPSPKPVQAAPAVPESWFRKVIKRFLKYTLQEPIIFCLLWFHPHLAMALCHGLHSYDLLMSFILTLLERLYHVYVTGYTNWTPWITCFFVLWSCAPWGEGRRRRSEPWEIAFGVYKFIDEWLAWIRNGLDTMKFMDSKWVEGLILTLPWLVTFGGLIVWGLAYAWVNSKGYDSMGGIMENGSDRVIYQDEVGGHFAEGLDGAGIFTSTIYIYEVMQKTVPATAIKTGLFDWFSK